MRLTIMLAAVLGCAIAAPALAQSVNADIACRPAGPGPVYDCLIKLADMRTKAPVADAKFTVSADMPSMPMAHNVRPVTAVSSGEPGTYYVRLALEMAGTWNVKLRLSVPKQGQIVRRVEFSGAR